MELCVADIVDAIQVLVSPVTYNDCQNCDAASFDRLLTVNIQKLREVILSSPKLAVLTDSLTSITEGKFDNDVRWHFVACNMQLLQLLCNNLSEISQRYDTLPPDNACGGASINPDTSAPPVSSDTLSLTHRKVVSTALQFISGLGICPLLLPGVGIPLHQRSVLACWLVTKDTTSCLSNCDKYYRLTACVDLLLRCLQQQSLASIVLSAHLCDLLAGLIQVCYSPVWKTYAAEFDEAGSRQCNPTIYLDELTMLVNKVSSSTLVRVLLLLQSGPPPSRTVKAPPRPPVWLRKVCQSYLQEILSKPNGLLNVLMNIVQGDDPSAIDSRKCDAAARIVVDCCQNESAYKHHFHNLAPQILRLLRDAALRGPVFRAVVAVVEAMHCRCADMTSELVTRPLLEPLFRCLDFTDISCMSVNTELVDETTLTETVLLVHKVFVLNCAPQSSLLLTLQPVAHVLFQLYCAVGKSVSLLRKPVEDLLQRLIGSCDAVTGAKHLKQLCLGDMVDFSPMHSCLQFVTGDCGGVTVAVTDVNREEWIDAADAVVDLLSVLWQLTDLSAEFFLLCLEELTNVVSVLPMLDELSLPSVSYSSQASLLDVDARVVRMEAVVKRNLSLLGIIAAVCDRFGDNCLQKTNHILRFAQATLERSLRQLDTDHGSQLGTFENETLLMALGLLGALVADADQAERISWDLASCLMPLLQQLVDTHPDTAIRQTAADVRVLIATHGRVSMSGCTSTATDVDHSQPCRRATDDSHKTDANDDATSTTKPLIEVISDDSATEQSESRSTRSSFETAVTEVADDNVPVRGHGLLTLRRLVDAGDSEALNSFAEVLGVCDKTVDDPDSYVYLNCVQLLSSLAARFPQRTLPWLADRYLAVNRCRSTDSELTVAQRRMKLGEVLVKTSCTLGPLIPHYRSLLLGTCLRACKDPDPLIRASAVSNLGQVCQHLHFSLGSVMYEVFDCIQALLKSDRDLIVKRSAAVCTSLLLRGLSKDCLKVLGPSLLHDFYKLLKHCRTVETDDILLLQVQLACDEIDDFMKDFLSPAPTLTKRIHVLDPLDVD